MSVELVAPLIVNGEVEITIGDADIKDELEFWHNSMILFALGNSLSMNALKRFMENLWSFFYDARTILQ
ncbi:unnamed protein product [Lathyrus sativus]|nr:unnamed protein product [Lathyrus sativus]